VLEAEQLESGGGLRKPLGQQVGTPIRSHGRTTEERHSLNRGRSRSSLPDMGRGRHGENAARGLVRATRDPLDIAVRHVDLPNGPRREPVRVRARDYSLNGNQSRVLATVGAFGEAEREAEERLRALREQERRRAEAAEESRQALLDPPCRPWCCQYVVLSE
jgi:hypothetical protein